MEKFKQYLLATVCLVIFISAATLLYPVPITGAPPAFIQGDVTVTNTPLDVAGSQSGTWNVGITNDDTNPVPVTVQNGATNDSNVIEITAAPTNKTPTVVFTVPNGQRVVITDVVIIGGGTGGGCCPAIQRNSVDIARVSTQPDRKYQQTYRSGIEFNQGDTVGVVGLNNVGEVFFELRGVQTSL